jgi:hypothetical protein
MQLVDFERIKTLVQYERETGVIYSTKTGRIVTSDYNSQVIIYDPETRKRTKVKKNILCWMLLNDRLVPSDSKILHRNLNEDDCKATNLVCIPRKTYNIIQEAYRNLSKNLKLIAHGTDKYSYKLIYYKDGKKVQTVVGDIVQANRELTRLRLKYAKILNKYCIF